MTFLSALLLALYGFLLGWWCGVGRERTREDRRHWTPEQRAAHRWWDDL